MKRCLILIALILTACAAPAPQLDSAMTASMNARADAYDAQYPGMTDTNVARECAKNPIGLYWHENGIWAVICVLPAMPNTYGAVLMDASYTVLSTEHISAASRSALEDQVFAVGWEAR